MKLDDLRHLPKYGPSGLQVRRVRTFELATVRFRNPRNPKKVSQPIEISVIGILNACDDDCGDTNLLMYHVNNDLSRQVKASEVMYVDIDWDLAEYERRSLG